MRFARGVRLGGAVAERAKAGYHGRETWHGFCDFSRERERERERQAIDPA